MNRNSQKFEWMLYGAYGTTGRLILETALQRGHRPIIAGRDPERLDQLARQHGLKSVTMRLDDPTQMRAALGQVALVVHAVGPYSDTGAPMVQACIDARCSYVDVNGEIEHLLAVQRADQAARLAGITLISAAGFGVTYGEAVADRVVKRLPDATRLRLSVASDNALRGAAVQRSVLSTLSGGGMAVREGSMVRVPLAHRTWTQPLGSGSIAFAAAPLPELVGAHLTTRVPEIVAGMPMPAAAARMFRIASPLVRSAARLALRRRGGAAAAAPAARSPAPPAERQYQSRIWAEAWNARGETAAAMLETGEGYRMAALAIVFAVESFQKRRPPSGAFTPTRAFGGDFALGIPDTAVVDVYDGRP